jgi:hypothetical protein
MLEPLPPLRPPPLEAFATLVGSTRIPQLDRFDLGWIGGPEQQGHRPDRCGARHEARAEQRDDAAPKTAAACESALMVIAGVAGHLRARVGACGEPPMRCT